MGETEVITAAQHDLSTQATVRSGCCLLLFQQQKSRSWQE